MFTAVGSIVRLMLACSALRSILVFTYGESTKSVYGNLRTTAKSLLTTLL